MGRVAVNPAKPVSVLYDMVDRRHLDQKVFHLGAAKYLDGRISVALAIWENLAISVDEPALWYNIGLGYLRLGMTSRAKEAFLRASQRMESGDGLVDLLWVMGDGEQARAASDRLPSAIHRDMYAAVIDQPVHTWSEAVAVKYQFLRAYRPPLKIAYVMTATNICGGVRVIFEQVEQLLKRGHRVNIASFGPKPNWYPLTADFYSINGSIAGMQQLGRYDIAISGFFWMNLLTLLAAPRTYHFAQGDEMTFGFDAQTPLMKDLISQFHWLPNRQLSVSSFLTEALANNFERPEAVLLRNAAEPIFCAADGEPGQVLFFGSETNVFKNVPMMIECVELLRSRGHSIQATWISSTPRINQTFSCEFHHAPAREKIAELLKRAQILISASDFEASPLPIIEAMQSKVAVVTSDCGGIRDYVHAEENALVVPSHSAKTLADAVERLLLNPEFRQRIAEAGWETVQEFSWEATAQALEDQFYRDLAEPWPLVP